MKRIFLKMICCGAFLTGTLFAQGAITQKPAPIRTEVSRPRETKSEEKKEELSKKLMQRKNELRKEEHRQGREYRNSETKEKNNSPK